MIVLIGSLWFVDRLLNSLRWSGARMNIRERTYEVPQLKNSGSSITPQYSEFSVHSLSHSWLVHDWIIRLGRYTFTENTPSHWMAHVFLKGFLYFHWGILHHLVYVGGKNSTLRHIVTHAEDRIRQFENGNTIPPTLTVQSSFSLQVSTTHHHLSNIIESSTSATSSDNLIAILLLGRRDKKKNFDSQ